MLILPIFKMYLLLFAVPRCNHGMVKSCYMHAQNNENNAVLYI